MSRTQTIPISVTQPYQICYAGDDPFLLTNNDLVNSVLIGDDSGVSAARLSTASVIGPLGSRVLSGDADKWLISVGSPVSVSAEPFTTAYGAPPSQIAEQIALSGIGTPVPQLIRNPNSVAAGGGAFGPLNFTFAVGGAYQLTFTPVVAGAAAVADITVKHLDVNSNVVYSEIFTVAVGSIGNFAPVIYRGNLQANQLQISGQVCSQAYLTALPADNGPFTLTGLNMGVYSLGTALANTSPKMVPSNTTQGTLQSFQAVSLGAGLSGARVSVFSYAGRMKWDVFSATAGNARAAINYFTVAGGATAQQVFRMQNDGTVSNVQEWVSPAMLGIMQVTNEGAATASITSHATMVDYI